ncbi:MAG: orotidine-5'-phosphate decarboxylase [Actinobacteria bacterium]|nr:orotidine-5'-phosphate decarboxylase [Actinomycetota bacterium]
MSVTRAPIAIALDTNEINTAKEWATLTSPQISTMKLGLEFFTRFGISGVSDVMELAHGAQLFLDLKLHDIPAGLAPTYLTVHASGGAAMISAAAQALPQTRITAVTVLTSLAPDDLARMGFPSDISMLVKSLAISAVDAGARAIVCSPQEVGMLREVLPREIHLLTPGVRPAGSAQDDQERVSTPAEAFAHGADLVVIGRPITSLWNPHSPHLMSEGLAEIISGLE